MVSTSKYVLRSLSRIFSSLFILSRICFVCEICGKACSMWLQIRDDYKSVGNQISHPKDTWNNEKIDVFSAVFLTPFPSLVAIFVEEIRAQKQRPRHRFRILARDCLRYIFERAVVQSSSRLRGNFFVEQLIDVHRENRYHANQKKNVQTNFCRQKEYTIAGGQIQPSLPDLMYKLIICSVVIRTLQ